MELMYDEVIDIESAEEPKSTSTVFRVNFDEWHEIHRLQEINEPPLRAIRAVMRTYMILSGENGSYHSLVNLEVQLRALERVILFAYFGGGGKCTISHRSLDTKHRNQERRNESYACYGRVCCSYVLVLNVRQQDWATRNFDQSCLLASFAFYLRPQSLAQGLLVNFQALPKNMAN